MSGKGQFLHTSLLQAQIFMLDFQASRWLMGREVAKQAGNNHPTSIPTGVFKTKDGFFNIAVTGNKIWERFVKTVGHEEWLKNPDYATAAARSKNRDALNAEIDKALQTETSATWVDRFNKAGVPCGPIYSIDQVFADEQVKHLGIAQGLDKPGKGRVEYVGQPVVLSRTPSSIQAHPPALGEHTDEVLSELGFDKAEIARMRGEKIV